MIDVAIPHTWGPAAVFAKAVLRVASRMRHYSSIAKAQAFKDVERSPPGRYPTSRVTSLLITRLVPHTERRHHGVKLSPKAA